MKTLCGLFPQVRGGHSCRFPMLVGSGSCTPIGGWGVACRPGRVAVGYGSVSYGSVGSVSVVVVLPTVLGHLGATVYGHGRYPCYVGAHT